MKIIPRFQYGGNTGIGRTTSDWYKYVHSKLSQHILDMLSKYGEGNDYGQWLNDMQHAHSQIYNAAGGANEAWKKKAYSSEDVRKYQKDYLGTTNSLNTLINKEDLFNYNNLGIANAYNNNVFTAPGKRLSGDNPNLKYNADGLYSSVTDWRRLLGRKGDWDENSQEFLNWKKQLNDRGWDTYLDNSDGYYKLKRLPLLESPNNPPSETPQKPNPLPQQTGGKTEVGGDPQGDKKETPQQGNDILGRLRGMIPGLLSTGRLAGNLINNARVYDEALKGIRPTLLLPYYTHRQVVGDEATKQAYYRRAAAGLTAASRPFTSDADRQMAYMQEARRVGDELRAQGDLADNQEIRRTSDESNQHQWANTQRATEVANTNLASLNDANEKKHTLLAQKHSALWSSIDNYLKEIETRKRLLMEEDNAYANQIHALSAQNDYENDEEYLRAYENLKKLGKVNEVTGVREYDTTNPDVIAALKALRIADFNRQKRMLESIRNFRLLNRTLFVKSGSKITYKKDDKLLYKSTKDVVDHFRRMCRRYPEKERKIQPLAPHPDGTRRRKYQVGGQFLAPFTVYTPAVGIGESSRTVSLDTGTSSKSSSSSKDTTQKDMLDLIKMFKDVKGIKVDVSSIYSTIAGIMQEAEVFGKELNSQQIASMYLRAMLQLNNVSRSKEIYDEAYKVAAANGALNEIAVNSIGQYAVLDKETGEIKMVSLIDTSKHIPLTNSLLLTFREFKPELAFNKGDEFMLNVVANGVGLSKIGKEIKDLAGKLGSSELKLDGMSQVEAGKIKQGLQLLQGAPDGYYKTTTDTKNQLVLKQAAINYIISMLPLNYLAVLNMHGGAEKLIPTFLSSLIDNSLTVSISPLTGKASDKDKETSMDKLGINSATQLLLGMSSPREFAFSIGNGNMFNGMARVSSITKDGNPIGADFAYSDIYKSDLHKNLDLDNASFGDVPINKALKDRIIIDNSTIAGIDLPYTTDRNGRIIPDFQLLNRIEEADLEVLRSGINPETEPQKVNEIYAKHNLPIKYGADNRLTGNYKRFAVVLATAIEDVFLDKSGLASNGTLSLVSDEDEITKYVNEIKKTTGQKDIDMDRPGLFTGDKDVYKGSIFIPIIGDLVDAVSATGELKAGNYDELRNKYLTKNYVEAPLFIKQ